MIGSIIQVTGRTNYKDIKMNSNTAFHNVYRKVVYLSWEKWFAWYPVKIHGKRVWLKTVYRRSIMSYVDMDDWERYEYGTLFDILTE